MKTGENNMTTLKYFGNTDIDTIGDFQGEEEKAVCIIDTILEKIEDLIDEKYYNDRFEITNTDEIETMAWEFVCDYNEPFDETDADYTKSANKIFDYVEINVFDEE